MQRIQRNRLRPATRQQGRLEAGNIRMASVYVCKDNDEMRENYCYVKILMQETQVLKIIAQRRYDVIITGMKT